MNTNKIVLHSTIFFYLLILIVTTLPFFISINSIAIILLVINWLIEGNWKKKREMFLSSKYAIFCVIFYLYHIIGLFYSANNSVGLFELEKKLALIIFPLVFATSVTLNRKKIFIILYCFVTACFAAVVICLSNAIYFSSIGDNSYFFYHKLGSPIHFHAVYFSVYLGFAICILIYFLQDKWETQSWTLKTMLIFLVTLFLFFLLLLSSKTVSISVLIITLLYLLVIMYKRKKIIIGILFFVLVPTLSVIMVKSSGNIQNRFNELSKENYFEVLKLDDYRGFQFTGGTIRVAIWKSVFEILNEEKAWIFGVGTGDSQDLLTKKYMQKNIYPGDGALGHIGFIDYNAHNQYFQFLITLGVSGLFIFFFLLSYPIIHNPNNVLQILFIFIFCTFCFTESALCAHKGVVFYSFFNSLFFFGSYNKENKEQN
ncbi:MAG: O-antigen ligase family protein [Bacteroidota bacterium]